MPEFTLDPDDAPPTPRQPRLVTTGPGSGPGQALAPTAEVPTGRSKRDHPPCYAPCAQCGMQVLTGCTPSGQRVALDTGVRTYVVQPATWFPLHICGVKPTVSEELQFSQQVCGVEAKHTLHTCELPR